MAALTVQAIDTWARSLGNISSSQAWAQSDTVSSVNMWWQDIYARLLEKDDDYFAVEATFSSLTPYATVNPNEYKIPLPADFYQLRFVDWQPGLGGQWQEAHRFPLSMRNEQPSDPYYRLQGTNLWIVGANVSAIRIDYYPVPKVWGFSDTISYPINVPLEILAFQVAIDACTKLTRTETLAILMKRLGDPDSQPPTGLWATFKKLIKRDIGEGERIKNSRAGSWQRGMM